MFNDVLKAIRDELKNANCAEISRNTGLHLNTIYNIRDGRDTNPKIDTLEKLAKELGL